MSASPGFLPSSGCVVSKFAVAAATAATVATVVLGGWAVYDNARLRQQLSSRAAGVTATRTELEQQLRTESDRLAAAEKRLGELLASSRARTAGVSTAYPATRVTTTDAVEQAQASARDLIAAGKLQDALDVYVACYREIEPLRPGSGDTQRLMSAIVALARKYPAARAALGQLRDTAMVQFMAEPARRHELGFEIALLNEKLGEGARTIDTYDQLPRDDSARASLGRIAYAAFVNARRYEEAVASISFGEMLSGVESGRRLLGNYSPEQADQLRRSVVASTVLHIESLTGAGRLADAQTLTDRLLAFDNSEATQTAVREHVERARSPR